ncbi:MAG: rane protein [Candidatus Saccharibacteria bacterium]|nr:rane protein [Candidatus Saccharibacteria bacterium]
MRKLKKLLLRRTAVKIYVVCVMVFVIANVAAYGLFLHRTYPNSRLNGRPIGSLSDRQLQNRLQTATLPTAITLRSGNKSLSLKPAELGLSVDEPKTIAQAHQDRSWLPILNFITSHNSSLALSLNEAVYVQVFHKLQLAFEQPATDARLSLQDGKISLQSEKSGVALDRDTVRHELITQAKSARAIITLPAALVKAAVAQTSLQKDYIALQTQLGSAVTYTYQAKAKKLTSNDIATWYAPAGNGFVLSDANIKTSIQNVGQAFGISIQNITEAVTASKSAVQSNKPLSFALVAVPPHSTFSYCVAARGVDISYLAGLKNKLQSTYGDSRGWGLGGAVIFNEVGSGCNFTVWLSAASQMPSFGSICDSLWSCTVSPNVIINFDRWQGASSAWSQSGGSLDDYRSMVINHETGHWLGFGHRHCSGAGQLAPVMQQQSIDLEGCKFNPWPLPLEQAALRSSLGL